MNEFIIMNYFMVRSKNYFHSVLLRFYSTSNLFRLFDVSNAGLLEKVHSFILVFPRWYVFAAVLFSLSILLRYLVDSLFSLWTRICIPILLIRYCPGTLYCKFGSTFLKDSSIVRYSESGLIILCKTVYLQHNILIVYKEVLIPILLILSKPVVSTSCCFDPSNRSLHSDF